MTFVCDDGASALVCRVCTSTFTSQKSAGRSARKKFCSLDCAKEANRARSRIRAAEAPSIWLGKPAPCLQCGNTFLKKDKIRKYCSHTCAKAKSRVYPSRRAQAVAYEKRRRARLRSVETERFSDAYIHERDGWVCGLCNRKIDKKLMFPHWMSASLDHIIPLSDGGGHTRANVQSAHWICNSRKSDGPGGQMKLFG